MRDQLLNQEMLNHINELRRLQKIHGIDHLINPQFLSNPINDLPKHIRQQIDESLKFNRQFSRTNYLTDQLPKFDYPNIHKELDLIKNNTLDKFRSEIPSELFKFEKPNFLNDRNFQDLFRQQQELANSRLGTAIFASSLRQDEIDIIRQNTLNNFDKIRDLNLPKQFSQVVLNSLNQSKIWEQIDSLKNSYAGRLTVELRDIIENSVSREEAFEKIDSVIDERISEIPDSKFTRFERISLIFLILMFVISLYDNTLQTYQAIESKKSGDEQKIFYQTLIKLNEEIVKNTEQDTDEPDSENFYELEREAQLKIKPEFKSATIANLIPKTRVRVISKKHKWIYVECFNYIEGVPQYGWISKKYLSKLD